MENRLTCIFIIFTIFFVQQVVCEEKSNGTIEASFSFMENLPINLSKLVSFRLPSNGIEILVKDVETDEPIENAGIVGTIASHNKTFLELRTRQNGKAFIKISGRENHALDIVVSALGYAQTSWKGQVSPENRRLVVYMFYDPFKAWMRNNSLSFSRNYNSQENRLGWYFDYRWEYVKDVEAWQAPSYENKSGWKLESYWAADVYHWEIVGYQDAQQYTWVKTASGVEYDASFGEYYGYNVGNEFYPPESDGSYKYKITSKRIDTIGYDTRQISPILPSRYGYFYPPWTGGNDKNLSKVPVKITVRADINKEGDPEDCFSLKLNLYMKAVENGNEPTTFEGQQTFTISVDDIITNGFSNRWRISNVTIGSSSVLGQSSSATVNDYGNWWHYSYPSGPVYYFEIFGENSQTSNDAPRVRAYYKNMTVELKKIKYVFVVDRYDWMLTNTRVPVYGWVYKGELEFSNPPENTSEYRYYNVRIKYHVYRKYVDAYENIFETYYYLPYPIKHENLYVARLNGYTDNLLLGTSLLSGENVTLWVDNVYTVPITIDLYDADVWAYTIVGKRIAVNEWIPNGESVFINGEDAYGNGVGAGDLFVDEDGLRLFGVREVSILRSGYIGIDSIYWCVNPPINAVKVKYDLENSKLVATISIDPQGLPQKVTVLDNVANVPFSDIRFLTGREFRFSINLHENIYANGMSRDNICVLHWEYDPSYLTIWGPETLVRLRYYEIIERRDYPRGPCMHPDDYGRYAVYYPDPENPPSILFLADTYDWAYKPTPVYKYDWVYAGRWTGLSFRPENSKRFRFENITSHRKTENAYVFRLAFYPNGRSNLRFSVMDSWFRRSENMPFEIRTNDPSLPDNRNYLLYYASRPLGSDIQENNLPPQPPSDNILLKQKEYLVSITYDVIEYQKYVNLTVIGIYPRPAPIIIGIYSHYVPIGDPWYELLYINRGYERQIEVGIPKGYIFRAYANIDSSYRLAINWDKVGENDTHDIYILRLIQPVGVKPFKTDSFKYGVNIEATSGNQTIMSYFYVNVSSNIRIVAKIRETAAYVIFPPISPPGS